MRISMLELLHGMDILIHHAVVVGRAEYTDFLCSPQ